VWLDYDDIGPGEQFEEALNEALAQSDNLLAIIGPDWLTAVKDGHRRLDDPEDWVRREVAAGLSGRAAVTPVLVGNAQLPTAEELPEPLKTLPARQAIEVRPERFDDDVEDLIRRIGGWRRRWHGFPLWAWAATVTAVVALLVVAFVVRRNMAPLIDPEQIEAVAGVPVEVDLLSWADDDRDGPLTLIPDPISENQASVEDLGDGRVIYTAQRTFHGDDSFGFRVRDEGGLETSETAHVHVLLGAMGGAFNIAVTEMAATGAEEGVGLDLSQAVHDQIVEDLAQADVEVAVEGPGVVGPLSGETSEMRAEAAAELADRVHADVVVFGTVEIGDGLTDVAAEYFVSDRGLTGAEELAGAYPLDTISLATTDPVAVRRRTAEELQPRILGLTDMALGLSHSQLNEYSEAEVLFEEALESWPDANGRVVVLSLLGNVNGFQDDLDSAESYFTDALSLDPNNARSRFGAAELTYLRARGPICGGSGEVDLAGLEDAVSQFEEVGELPSPPLAFIPERARIEVAKIYQCMYQNRAGHLDDAREILEGVLAEISDETRLVDLAADVHFSLGIQHLLERDQQAAIAEFEEAVETTRNEIRKRSFHYSLAFIYQCQLDQRDRAEVHMQEAESLPGPQLDPIQCDA
jgi:tetratricopeptide (TPR) repeat protein